MKGAVTSFNLFCLTQMLPWHLVPTHAFFIQSYLRCSYLAFIFFCSFALSTPVPPRLTPHLWSLAPSQCPDSLLCWWINRKALCQEEPLPPPFTSLTLPTNSHSLLGSWISTSRCPEEDFLCPMAHSKSLHLPSQEKEREKKMHVEVTSFLKSEESTTSSGN